MEIRKIIFISLFAMLVVPIIAHAGWTGPTTIVAGTWGTGTTQFGIEEGDTSDNFPDLGAVLPNGQIIIEDNVNNRFDIYDMSGNLVNNIYWYVNHGSSGTVNPTFGQYQFANVQGYTSTGNVWMNIQGYLLKSPTGTLLTTSTTRPMELGILSQKITGTSHYKRIEYPDGVYFYYYTGETSYFDYASGIIRINTNLIMDVHNGFQPARVYAFTATAIATPAGQKQQYQLFLNSSWVAPLPQYAGSGLTPPSYAPPGAEPPPPSIVAEYGRAVIGPDGSIYTYDRSDSDYKIVKWTWTP